MNSFSQRPHNPDILKDRLTGGMKSPGFFPLPVLEASMKNRAVALMEDSIGENRYQFSVRNYVCEMAPYRLFLRNPEIKCTIGDFDDSAGLKRRGERGGQVQYFYTGKGEAS
jgi:hypothetical protein